MQFFRRKKMQLQGIEVLSVWEGIVYFRNSLNHMIPRNAQVTILSNYFELETRLFHVFLRTKKKSFSSFLQRMKCTKRPFAAIWSKATLLNDAKCTNKLETHNNKNDSYTRLTCTVRLAIDWEYTRCLHTFLIVFIFCFVLSFSYSLFLFLNV